MNNLRYVPVLMFFLSVLLLTGCSKTVVLDNSSIVLNMSEDNETIFENVSAPGVSDIQNVSINSSVNSSIEKNNTLNMTNSSNDTGDNSGYDDYRNTDLIDESISDIEDLA
ncbi:MAG: hypothetical protein ACP5NV_06345 [Candidatus Woesearchaeota archaeon]